MFRLISLRKKKILLLMKQKGKNKNYFYLKFFKIDYYFTAGY